MSNINKDNIISESTYNKIIESIRNNENSPDGKLEIEVRFGKFHEHKKDFGNMEFKSNIDIRAFTRLKEQMNKIVKPIISETIDRSYYKYGNYRVNRTKEIYTSDITNNIKYKTIKENKSTFDIYDYDIRVSISTEKNIKEDEPEIELAVYTREKNRYSYYLLNNLYRLDLTQVKIKQVKNRDIITYINHEIELEILNSTFDKKNFITLVELILNNINNSHILYSSTEKSDILNKIRILLPNEYGDTKTFVPEGIDQKGINYNIRKSYIGSLNPKSLSQSRALKARDLVVGGIIPNIKKKRSENNTLKNILNSSEEGVTYTATIKADGVRKLMFIDERGIYFAMAPMELNKILSKHKYNGYNSTIIEGELVKANNKSPKELKDKKYIFLMYDILCINGDTTVRNIPIAKRVKELEKIENNFEIEGLKLFVKKYHYINSSDDFYRVNKLIFDEMDELWYDNDGIIYTPTTGYLPDLLKISVENLDINRRLSYFPDIIKWKPINMLSIDFGIMYVNINGNIKIRLYVGRKEIFKGSELYKFDQDTGIDETGLLNLPEETVVEMKWNKILKKFQIIKSRDDKVYPNSTSAALSNWDSIHNEITEDFLKGDIPMLMFRNHNKEKNKIFKYIEPNNNNKTAICIGSGRGGDIIKMKNAGFTKILFVEPDAKNREILYERLKDVDINYKVLPAMGQEVERIFNETFNFFDGYKVDSIFYMLSLSFFFDTPESIRSIASLAVNCLKDDGYLASLTIDGFKLNKLFNDTNMYVYLEGGVKKLNLKQFDIRYLNEGNKIYFHIPNTIVTEQYEYLTNLKGLTEYLKTFNIKLIAKGDTTDEKMMNNEELLVNSLYTWIIYKKFV